MKNTLLLAAILTFGQFTNAAEVSSAQVLTDLKSRLHLTVQPEQTEYIKKTGTTGSNYGCTVTFENSKDALNVTITVDDFNNQFVHFRLPSSGKNITDLKYVDVGMYMSASSNLDQLRQELVISTNTSTVYTVKVGSNSTSCAIPNF